MKNTIEMNFPGGKKVDCRVGNFTVHTDQTENMAEKNRHQPLFNYLWPHWGPVPQILPWNFVRLEEFQPTGCHYSHTFP